MAGKRMLSRSVMLEDLMLSLPVRAQVCYVHLILQADDDGIVDRSRSICKMLGVKPKEYQLLVDNGYLIPFNSGVVAIIHWHIHNRVRKDTYTPTKYVREWRMLEIDAAGMYRLRNNPVTEPVQDRPPGKDRVEKDSEEKEWNGMEAILLTARGLGIPDSFSTPLRDWFAFKHSRNEEQSSATIHSTLVQIKRNLDQHGENAVEKLIRLSIQNGWKGIFFERIQGGSPQSATEYSDPMDFYV